MKLTNLNEKNFFIKSLIIINNTKYNIKNTINWNSIIIFIGNKVNNDYYYKCDKDAKDSNKYYKVAKSSINYK